MAKRLFLIIFGLLITSAIIYWQKDVILKIIIKSPKETHGVAEPKDTTPTQTDQNTVPISSEPTTSSKPKIKSKPKTRPEYARGAKSQIKGTTSIENDISPEEEEKNLQANDKKSVSQ